jgi:WD40 repeat protein
MKQKHPVTAIAFSTNDSLMVSGDETGNIILWDL